jgi:hypothetical protein
VKRAWAAVVMVGLAAFSCSAGGTTSPADPTTISSASTSESLLIAPACATYQDFVTHAHHDILKGARSDAEIVKRLAKYQDSLEAGAHALTNERYRDAGHATLGMADAIGHLKNSIASFGLHSRITVSAIRKAGIAGQQLRAFC